MNNQLSKLLGIETGLHTDCLGLYISMSDMYFAETVKKETSLEIKGLVRIPVVMSDKTSLKPLELNEGFFANHENWVIPLKKLLEKKKIKNNKVVVSLAPSFSILRHFVVNNIERKYWKQSIPLQARKYIHFPFDKAVFSYNVKPFETTISKQKKLAVLFAMTSESIIKHLTSGLKSIGLELEAVELSVFSQARAYRYTDKEAVGGKGRIYSFFGADSGDLLFMSESLPVLFRHYEFLGPLPIERRKLDLGNLIDFISKQFERDPFEETVAMGHNLDEWSRVLGDESRKIVRRWDLKEVFGFAPNSAGEIAAIGACSKFLDLDVPDLDLLKNNRMTPVEANAIKTLWKVAALVLLGCAGFLGYKFMGFKSVSGALAVEQRNTIKVDDFAGQSPETVLSKINSLERKRNEIRDNVRKEAFVTPKLVYFADNMPEDMWINKFSYVEPYNLQGSGKLLINMEGIIAFGDNDVRADMTYGDKFIVALRGDKKAQEWCVNPTSTYPIEGATKGKGTRFIFKCEGK